MAEMDEDDIVSGWQPTSTIIVIATINLLICHQERWQTLIKRWLDWFIKSFSNIFCIIQNITTNFGIFLFSFHKNFCQEPKKYAPRNSYILPWRLSSGLSLLQIIIWHHSQSNHDCLALYACEASCHRPILIALSMQFRRPKS